MRKTNAVWNAAIALLFTLVLLYLGMYAYKSFHSGYVTAEAVPIDLNITAQASGLIVREETVLNNDRSYVDVVASDGTAVAVGETVANAMNSQSSMESTARMHELELQISRAEAAADTRLNADTDNNITTALVNLSAAVARGEMTKIYDPEVVLTTHLLQSANTAAVSEEELSQMKAELSRLQTDTKANATAITSPAAGIFSTVVDGYEWLGPSDLTALTPAKLKTLIDQRNAVGSNLGKVVTGTKWYFAALVDKKDAKNLKEGSAATLDLGKYASGKVTAVVQQISVADKGQCAVVFKCRTAMNETLALRQLTAEIVYDEISGLRVPVKAVHLSEDGTPFVYVISAMKVEEKPIEILYTADDYYIAAIGTAANALRAGNEIIVSGRGLTDGALIG